VTWNQSRSRSKSTTLLVAAVLPLGAPSCSWGRHPPSPNPFPFVVRTAAAESSHPLPVGRRRLPVLLRAAFFSSSSRPSRPPRPRPRAASRGRALPPPPWQPPPAPRARSGPSRAGSAPWPPHLGPGGPSPPVRPSAPHPSPVLLRPAASSVVRAPSIVHAPPPAVSSASRHRPPLQRGLQLVAARVGEAGAEETGERMVPLFSSVHSAVLRPLVSSVHLHLSPPEIVIFCVCLLLSAATSIHSLLLLAAAYP